MEKEKRLKMKRSDQSDCCESKEEDLQDEEQLQNTEIHKGWQGKLGARGRTEK